jgi:hypothetical protein
MPRPLPTASRNGVRANAVAAVNPAAPKRPTVADQPVFLPIRRPPRLLSAGTQEVPEGAHSFRVWIIEPGYDAFIGEHPSRVIQPAQEVTVVIDYLTEDQARLACDLPADSGILLGP